MAASSRPVSDHKNPLSLKEIIPVANAYMLAIIDEYLHYRTAPKPGVVHTVTTGIASFFKSAAGQNRSLERKERCASISEKIKKVYMKDAFIDSVLEILILCEREARSMQREAAKNEHDWLRSDSSMCAKALHAVRSCLFTGMKSSKLKQEFESAVDAKSDELLAQLKQNHTSVLINIDAVDITNLTQEREDLIGKLAALQHMPTIKEAFIEGKFEIYKPLKEKATDTFQAGNKIKLNVNIPDIFHPAYFFIYYLFNLQDVAERIMKYNSSYQSYLIDVKPEIIIESSESRYFARMGTMVVGMSSKDKKEDPAEKEKAEKEKAEKEKAEKEKAEKEKVEKEKAEKEKAEKEKAEKEKAEKEKAEKEKAEKEKAEKEKAENEKAEKEKAENEKAEKEQTEKRHQQGKKR